MFKGDDDDDEEATMGAVRYSVMPSLVALQQMRNRLHLAYLGRKLMKWTALATGKELRRISLSIAQSLENYAEQMSTAYMLLARARFYVPKLNDVVLENIAVNASSNCGVSMRSISGVKITKFTLQETGYAPYPLLGIEKGGMAIYDAKRSWLNLLKLMIKILQQRTTFKAVEQAHRSATQKQNVLSRVIIPRIVVTMRYIVSELDEQEREETFRLKRFKELKYKHSKVEEKVEILEVLPPIKEEVPPKEKPIQKKIEEKVIDEKPKVTKEQVIDEKPKEKIIDEKLKATEEKVIDEKPKVKDEKPIPEMIQETVAPKQKIVEEKISDHKVIESITDKITIPEILRDEKLMDTLTHTNICACCLTLFAADDEPSNQFLCPLCQLKAKAKQQNQDLQLKFVRCPNSYPRDDHDNERLEHLKAHMNEAIDSADQAKTEPSDDTKRRVEELTCQPPPCDGVCAAPEQRDSKIIVTSCTNLPPTPTQTTQPTSVSPRRSSERDRPTQASSNTYKLTPVPKPKLGYFEKKYKEIVKVTRLRNPDGSISEEKQVITIKTERRMPKNEENEGNYKEQQYIGAYATNATGTGFGGGGYGGGGGGGGYSGERGGGNDEGGYGRKSYDEEYGGRGRISSGGNDADGYNRTYPRFSGVNIPGNECHGYVEGGQRSVYPPTETKSEASNRSAPMGEPNIRLCMSSSNQNKGTKSLSIGPDEVCPCFDIPSAPPPPPTEKVCTCESKATSVDSKQCCPDRSRFMYSTELTSGLQSPKPQKNVTKCTSVQTCCCCFLTEKKSTADKSSACKPTCRNVPIRNKEHKCINTDVIQNEVSIASTNPTRTSSASTNCNNSFCSKRKGTTNSGCTVKTSKSSKARSCGSKDDDSEVVLKGSMLNALRKIILPSCKSTQCSQKESTNRLCSHCQSMLASSSGQKCPNKLKNNPTCFVCRTRNEVEREEEFVKVICDSCGTIGKYSSTSATASTKSAAVGSSSTSSPFDYSSSNSNKSSDAGSIDYKPTGSSLAQTIRSVALSCPSFKPSEICCPKPKTVAKLVGEPRRVQTRDAMTSTKRSDKYDCRPLRSLKDVHACEKIRSRSCTCHSDSHMLKPKSPYPLPRSQSCCEDIYFYKW